MSNPTPHTDSRTRSLALAGAGDMSLTIRRSAAPLLLALAAAGAAQAQMVPHAEHALRQNTGNGNYTAVRIDLQGVQSQQSADGEEVHGRGLALRGQGFWPHWEGRVGVVIDRPINPLKDSFVLAQPNQGSGLRVRSMHILSDYYVEGGFRATAGLVQGNSGQSWWSSGGTGGGLNLSIQRLDSLGLAGASANPYNQLEQSTSPYVGAGYTNNLTVNGVPSAWRFNADLGLISINSNNINRIGQVFQGDRSLDDLVHELRLRPIIKVSVGYSF
jgi:hypothetical protein